MLFAYLIIFRGRGDYFNRDSIKLFSAHLQLDWKKVVSKVLYIVTETLNPLIQEFWTTKLIFFRGGIGRKIADHVSLARHLIWFNSFTADIYPPVILISKNGEEYRSSRQLLSRLEIRHFSGIARWEVVLHGGAACWTQNGRVICYITSHYY